MAILGSLIEYLLKLGGNMNLASVTGWPTFRMMIRTAGEGSVLFHTFGSETGFAPKPQHEGCGLRDECRRAPNNK